MNKFQTERFNKFLADVNRSIADIENGRFTVQGEILRKRGNSIKVIVVDNKNNTLKEDYFIWHSLTTKNGGIIYDPAVMRWVNNTIVSARYGKEITAIYDSK